ncbi:MAG: hypothetical protein HKP58_04790 [Desulfatitalea sp.]|nr:hypothetical protein [Desulfatitalea sp.]NNJ99709.1 hypothetical protein [Desulfatitalea sp.]
MQAELKTSSKIKDKQALEPNGAHWRIGLVGQNTFQNRLLKSVLNEGMKQNSDFEILEQWSCSDEACTFDLILWDGYSMDANTIWFKLNLGGAPNPMDQPIALYNIDPRIGVAFERQAIGKRIHGVFYTDEKPEYFLRGIKKILNGELWYSRKTTSEILMDAGAYRASLLSAEAMLTRREKEILIAIASGASNNEIASEYFISLNTVKSHISKIYRKISVKNRLEATLWAARYM